MLNLWFSSPNAFRIRISLAKRNVFIPPVHPIQGGSMGIRRLIYVVAVVTAALGMFLPIIYGSVGFVRELLGSNPLIKSAAVILISWLVAYVTFEEEESATAS